MLQQINGSQPWILLSTRASRTLLLQNFKADGDSSQLFKAEDEEKMVTGWKKLGRYRALIVQDDSTELPYAKGVPF